MKIYNVIYKRQILNELEFEVEAENEDEARDIAQEDLERMDWEYINENSRGWEVEKVEDLGDSDESED
jgi:hypothetical protein